MPGFDNGTTEFDAIPENNLRAFYLEPKDEGGSNAYCTYCPDQIQLFLNGVPFSSNCSDSMKTQKCLEFVYDHSRWSQTVAMKFDTVCDNAWKMDLVKSLFMVGVMLSVSVGGSIADRYGGVQILSVSVSGSISDK